MRNWHSCAHVILKKKKKEKEKAKRAYVSKQISTNFAMKLATFSVF